MSNTMGKRLLGALGVMGLLLLGTVYWVQAAPPGQSAEEGRVIFEAKCASCHTVGGGDGVGPDLIGVAELRDPAWLARWLDEPDVMLAEGDSIATELLEKYNGIPMPNQNLSQAEIDALLAYLGIAEAAEIPAEDTQKTELAGSGQAGKDLFTGSTRFTNGGTACIACHDTAALGMPGGGTLGPDLRNGPGFRTGKCAIPDHASHLPKPANVPFPTMRPIYQNRPLTPQEQADLALFLQGSAGEDAPSRWGRHVVLSLLAFVVMDIFLGLLFFWRRRLPQQAHRSLQDR